MSSLGAAERLRSSRGDGLARALAAVGRWLMREPVLIFLLSFAAYVAVGVYTTLHLRLVVGDAQVRLAHAYFALWNQPAKLASIGFFWPPLQTILLVPFAAIRPLATSLVALPVASGLFASGTLVVIERTLAAAGVGRPGRWAIVLAFGVNPMFAFYATNGMAESFFLFFLTAAVATFVRWCLEPRWYHPLEMGTLLSLGVLTRYEVGFWLPVLAGGVALMYLVQRARFAQIEASVLVIALPVAYMVGMWMYFNWALIGDPAGFIHGGLSVAGPTSPVFSHSNRTGPSSHHLAWQALRLQIDVFPATFVVAAALLLYMIVRRSAAALVLLCIVLLQSAAAMAWTVWSGGGASLHLRYNMRAMPLTVAAAAWLLAVLPRRWRMAATAGLVATLAVSIPVSGRTMLDYRNSTGEHAFVQALRTGKVQDAIPQPFGTDISLKDGQTMAAYIRTHIRGKNVILTDDADTFGVMLADGHPERYLDRIDVRGRRWKAVRDDPVGKVRYFLVQAYLAQDRRLQDQIVVRYPNLFTPGRPSFIRKVAFQNRKYALFSIYQHRVFWGQDLEGKSLQWFSKEPLARYLALHGISWRHWRALHPAKARILVRQSR